MANKICTSIEQSKRLIELGIDMNTADMSYSFIFNSETYELSTVPYKDWRVPKYAKSDKFEQVISAWSLSGLLELLPDKIQVDNENYYLNLHKANVEYRGPMTYGGQKSITFGGANLIDAIFEAICWLKIKK